MGKSLHTMCVSKPCLPLKEHHPNRGIAMLLVVFFLLSTFYNITIPLGEGPDEPGHMHYVLFLAREGRLPVQRKDASSSDVPGEGHQPPLAYVLFLPAVAWLAPDEQHIVQRANPDFVWNGGDDSAAFMRASREYWPWQGVTLAWHAARGISGLLGAATVLCIWGAARVWHHHTPPGTAYLAAALVTFNPQFLFTSALVTNDMLLAALSAALFWLCMATLGNRSLRVSQGTSHLTAIGILAGLALITKQSALLLVPLLLWFSWAITRGNIKRFLVYIAHWGGITLLLAGWWYVRNWQLYGDPFGLHIFKATFATQPFHWQDSLAWRGALQQLHASFWARFGWLSVRPPTWVLACYTVLEVVALAGLLRLLVSVPFDKLRERFLLSVPLCMPLLLLPVLAFLWTVSFAWNAGLVAWQGRMLFPALPAIAILMAWGLSVLRKRYLIPIVITSLLLMGIAIYLPWGVIAPAYTWYTAPAEEAQAHIVTPAYARYAREWEQGVELHGWRMHTMHEPIHPHTPIASGQTITITVTWHVLEYVPENWTVFLHVVDDTGTILAEHNGRPLSGRFPTTLWTPGDWIEDSHPLDIPDGLLPGTYTLRVGLYTPREGAPHRGRRQHVWDAHGDPMEGDYATVGQIEIGKGETIAPTHTIFTHTPCTHRAGVAHWGSITAHKQSSTIC